MSTLTFQASPSPAVMAAVDQIRHEQGLAMTTIAQTTSISRSRLYRCRAGGGELTVSDVISLAAALGLAPDELLYAAEEAAP